MPTRLSLTEQYDNRDVVAQIYRLISLVESSTITDVITSKSDDNVIVTLVMYDGTTKDFMFKSNGIHDIFGYQNGSRQSVVIETDDGTRWTFSFDIAIAGMTTDTPQTVTAIKTFTVSPAFPNGLNVTGGITTPEADIDRLSVGEIDLTGLLRAMGSVTLDGEVQITNGHSLAVAGDVNVAGDMQVAGNTELLGDTEIAGMAMEKSGNRTVLSNSNGITVVGEVTEEVPTTPTGTRGLGPANGQRVQNDLDNYTPMVRDTGNKTISGVKTFTSTINRKNTISSTVESYVQSKAISIFNVNENEMGYLAVGKTSTAEITEIGQKSTSNPNYYSKLLIKMTDDSRVDLVLESQTSKGYEQHIIYTFGADA